MLKKYKPNEEIEFRPVYYNNSTPKTVIILSLVQKMLFKKFYTWIDDWINEESCWIVELIKFQYINISTHRPLSGSSYVNFPAELRSSKNGLINIKNNDQK